VRLAKCGGDRVLTRIELAARERDLSGVGAHRFRAVREDHAGLVAVGDCDQDSRGPNLGRGELALVEQAGQLDTVALVEQPREAVEQRAHAGVSAKVAP
jgi:hypothetical protein